MCPPKSHKFYRFPILSIYEYILLILAMKKAIEIFLFRSLSSSLRAKEQKDLFIYYENRKVIEPITFWWTQCFRDTEQQSSSGVLMKKIADSVPFITSFFDEIL